MDRSDLRRARLQSDSRRRSWPRALATAAGTTILLAGPAVAAAQPVAAEPVGAEPVAETAADHIPAETITFTGVGTVPLVCGSRPDATSRQVTRGKPIILANLTGAEASVDIGAEAPVTVANGNGISVKLSLGTHVLRMVPNCLLVGEVGQVVVNVVPAKAAPSPQPDPDGSPTPGPAGGSAPGPPVARPSGPAPSGAPSARTVGGDASAPAAAAADPSEAALADDYPDLVTVPLDRTSDDGSTRLLAIVAAICALGVTTGIIRAIVTYCTTSSLRTSGTK